MKNIRQILPHSYRLLKDKKKTHNLKISYELKNINMKTREIIGNLMVLGTILIYSFNTNFMKVLMPEWIVR